MRYAAYIEKLGMIENGFVGGTKSMIRANTIKTLSKKIEESRWFKSSLHGLIRNKNKILVKIIEYPIGKYYNAVTIDSYIEDNGARQ